MRFLITITDCAESIDLETEIKYPSLGAYHVLLSRSPCAPVVPRDHRHSWEAAQLIGLSLAVAVNTFVHTRSTSRGRSNHDLNAFLAPGRPAERRLGIRAIATPPLVIAEPPN